MGNQIPTNIGRAMVEIAPLLTAHKLSKENQETWERINAKLANAKVAGLQAQEVLDTSYSQAFDEYLGPFAELFARLKNVDLDQLSTVAAVPELEGLDIELKAAGLKAIGILTSAVGGGVVGIAAGGVTLAGVTAFATASTGTAISALSGAAASSATLAWLGGGSLAAGGGGMAAGTIVLGGVIALPAAVALIGYLHLKGKKSVREQQSIQVELTEAEWDVDIHSSKVTRASAHARHASTAVDRLKEIGTSRLVEFADLLERSDDYSTYTQDARQTVAENAGVATAIAAVIACPLFLSDGRISTTSGETVHAATTLAHRLTT